MNSQAALQTYDGSEAETVAIVSPMSLYMRYINTPDPEEALRLNIQLSTIFAKRKQKTHFQKAASYLLTTLKEDKRRLEERR